MKRRFIKKGFRLNDSLVSIPEDKKDLIDYANRLNLLNDIPLTYLLTDPSDLPEESIRFGIVDINWTDAYIDGAFSIGRVCGEDSATDKKLLGSYKNFTCNKLKYLDTPRMKKMHPTHSIKHSLLLKSKMNQGESLENLSEISVVLIRSELINLKKGFHFLGYKTENNQEEQLNTLRIEKISNDIMICLFSGIIDKFIIEEPLTGLKFGCKYTNTEEGKTERTIDIRSAKEEDFGKTEATMPIDDCVEDSGRINVVKLSDKIGSLLKDNKLIDYTTSPETPAEFSPSRFTFEMLSIPHRYVFLAETQDTNK